MEEKKGLPTADPTPFWLMYGNDLHVNSLFFRRGLLIVSPTIPEETVSETQESFRINSREFFFHLPDSDRPNTAPRALKKTMNLLNILIKFGQNKNEALLPLPEKPPALFNKNRREEIFLPVLFDEEHSLSNLYLYPWLTPNNPAPDSFSGFSQFVTAGCMFGASLQAKTDKGNLIELINHRIRLEKGECINEISYNENNKNPFEEMLFFEFEKNCLLINAFSKQKQSKRLLYHLPVYDYLLFGLKLFLHKQITKNALENFLQLILTRQSSYQTTIQTISKKHGIKVSIQSPFDNLFQNLDSTKPLESILQQLNISLSQVKNMQVENIEEAFVSACLTLLVTNNYSTAQKQVWEDFLASIESPIKTIEKLFKIANAVMMGTASRGKPKQETCSLLPLSEKQIQLEYDNLARQTNKYLQADKLSPPYPSTFNLTTLEPVVTYSPTTQGLLFYFACKLASLAELMSVKELTHHAARNIGFFSRQNQENPDKTEYPVELNTLLPEEKRSIKH